MPKVHDRGGWPNDDPIDHSEHEMEEWERKVDALNGVLGERGLKTSDQLRRAIESMDLETYETTTLDENLVEDCRSFLKEGQEVEILFIEGNAVSVSLPAVVELKVTESSEGIKGDTANNPTKPATLETGVTVQVPLFVKPDDVLKINTEDGSYVGRA